MSPSKPVRGQSSLIARSGPGVKIQVVDTNYSVVGRGTGEIVLALAEGVYIVTWTSNGETRQRLVRLLPLAAPLVVVDEGSGKEGDAASSSEVTSALDIAMPPSRRRYGAEVLILVQVTRESDATNLAAGMRLLDGDQVAMRSSLGSTMQLPPNPEGTFAVRCYRVRPGQFTLRFAAANGETLDQAVIAIADRRTVVLMSHRQETVLLADDGKFTGVKQNGIDAGLTVIFSHALDAPGDMREQARLTGILTRDLAEGTGSLGSSFSELINAAGADPFLTLYGAQVVLSRLASQASPALDDPWPAASDEWHEFRAKWLKRALAWTRRAAKSGFAADATAAYWQLQAGGVETRAGSSLKALPMLEWSWRWALARSVRDAAAIPASADFRAAARSAGGSAPWLTWRAAAAKAAVQPVEDPREIPELVGELSAQVRSITETLPPDGSTQAFSALSLDAQATTTRALETANRISVALVSDAGLSTSLDSDPIGALATSFNAPARFLKRRLVRTIGEISRLEERLRNASNFPTFGHHRTSPDSADNGDPPALRRMIKFVDDPNKGRFGGRPARKGYTLRTRFKMRSKDWVAITMTIEAPSNMADGTVVEFFLHDSFKPSRLIAKFTDGRASREVTSYGGFTVGAWIPDVCVELELDLAHAADAPSIVRTR